MIVLSLRFYDPWRCDPPHIWFYDVGTHENSLYIPSPKFVSIFFSSKTYPKHMHAFAQKPLFSCIFQPGQFCPSKVKYISPCTSHQHMSAAACHFATQESCARRKGKKPHMACSVARSSLAGRFVHSRQAQKVYLSIFLPAASVLLRLEREVLLQLRLQQFWNENMRNLGHHAGNLWGVRKRNKVIILYYLNWEDAVWKFTCLNCSKLCKSFPFGSFQMCLNDVIIQFF